MVLLQNFLIHPRLIVETFKICFAHKLDEVLVSLEVCREQNQVVVVVVREVRILLEPTARRHVGFAPDDGFDPRFLRFPVELHRPEHVAMIGHRDGRLPERLHLLHQGVDLVGAVEEAVLGMEMQMNEL